jgi:molybdopterin converting factor small subunit
VGQRQVQVQVARGATASDVYDKLQDAYAGLAALRSATSFAVNREVVAENAVVENGDEVAFLQPVSGGSIDRIGA